MKAELRNSTYTVTVSPEEVHAFASTWPCSGLNTDLGFVFEFSASNGDLVDLNEIRDGRAFPHDDEGDGPALVALSDDACRFGAETLELEDVIAIRYPGQRP